MMIYADTSWWLAYKSRRDGLHGLAISLFDHQTDAQVLWTPWQRVEVFNTFRQVERPELISVGESRQLIRLIEEEVRVGYWPHVEFSWTNAVRRACELPAEHSLKMLMRGMDLFHVAFAIEVGAEAFLTFDDEQSALAGGCEFTLATPAHEHRMNSKPSRTLVFRANNSDWSDSFSIVNRKSQI